MADIRSLTNLLEPVRAAVTLDCPVEAAFEAFTKDIAAWWPLATHSVWEHEATTVRFDAGPDGRIVEIHHDGRESIWAEVLVWEPPRRLVLRWHPGRSSDHGQEVEVRFVPEGSGTLVALEHRDWQRTDAERREGYEKGWTKLLEMEFSRWVRANEPAWRQGHGEPRPWP